MSVRSDPAPTAQFAGMDIAAAGGDHVTATIAAAQNADASLGEANTLSTNHPDHPLRRTFVTNIRATLGELCLRKAKGTWAPSPEALRAMLQYEVPTRTHLAVYSWPVQSLICMSCRTGKKNLSTSPARRRCRETSSRSSSTP